MTQHISNALKGMAMGMAEVVPGVSGGTIAFITGIYERLLNAIKAISGPAINAWRKEGFPAFWQAVDGTFLLALLIGMGAGIVVGVFGMEYLLEHHPVQLWGFFFGLIIASALYVGRQIETWRWQEIVALLVGAVIAYTITILAPTEANTQLWFIFLAGAIAICALILPGVSGSFILLLLGLYTYIIPLIKSTLQTFDTSGLLVIIVFALGCLTGLFSFARVMSWMFAHFRSITLALLTGFMIGSLNKIWPWRKALTVITEEGERIAWSPEIVVDKVLQEANLLPQAFAEQVGEPQVLLTLGCVLFGFLLVFGLERVGR